MAFPVSPNDGDYFKEHKYDAATGAWKKLVAIESGYNSNGKWIRYSDGTQICELRKLYDAGSNVSIYRTSWTYPMPFVGDAPTVTFTVNSSYQSGVDNASSFVCGDTSGVNGSPSLTQVGMKIVKTAGYMQHMHVSHIAIGKYK